MLITLYHGTSDVHEEIINIGLKNPYLTRSYALAEYYAECAVDDVGGEPIVYKVQVETSLLRYDGNAMDEPVSFEDTSISELEEDVLKTFETWAKTKPEWVSERGIIVIPSTEYQISLDTVGSCWHEGKIEPHNLAIAE